MTAATQAATVAIIKKTAAMMANPIFAAGVAVAAGVMLVVKAVNHFRNSNEEAAEAVEKVGLSAVRSISALETYKDAYSKFVREIENETLTAQQRANLAARDATQAIIDAQKAATRQLQAELDSRLTSIENSTAPVDLHFAIQGDEKIQAILEKLTDFQEESATIAYRYSQVWQDTYDELTESDRRAAEMQQKARADALRQMSMDLMTAEERDLAELKRVYDERVGLFRGNNERLADVNAWYASQRFEINKQYRDSEAAEHQAYFDEIARQEAEAEKKREAAALRRAQLQEAALNRVMQHEMSTYDWQRKRVKDQISEEIELFAKGSKERVRLRKMEADLLAEIDRQEKDANKRKHEKMLQDARDAREKMIEQYTIYGDSAVSVLNSIASVALTLTANTDATARVVAAILQDIRGNPFRLTGAEGYHIFGNGAGEFDVMLSTSEVKVKHTSFDVFEISFTVAEV